MKSKNIYILIFSFLLISLSSCNEWFHKDFEVVSEISIFPIMELKGGSAIKKNIGDTWVEPGFNCSEVKYGDNDLNSEVIVDDSSVDMNTPGLYFISYTVKNSYGYKDVFYRTIIVTDPLATNTDITGNYKLGFTEVYMDVTHNGDDPDFYYSTNILSSNFILPSDMVNIGNNKYAIPRIWTEYSGGNYVDGIAEYDVTGFFPQLKFELHFLSKKGDVFVLELENEGQPNEEDNRVIWTKQ